MDLEGDALHKYKLPPSLLLLSTPAQFTDLKRDMELVKTAGAAARQAVLPGQESLDRLAAAIDMSYKVSDSLY